jgi:hypothetical protein
MYRAGGNYRAAGCVLWGSYAAIARAMGYRPATLRVALRRLDREGVILLCPPELRLVLAPYTTDDGASGVGEYRARVAVIECLRSY